MRMATSLDWIVLEIFLNSSQKLSHKRYISVKYNIGYIWHRLLTIIIKHFLIYDDDFVFLSCTVVRSSSNLAVYASWLFMRLWDTCQSCYPANNQVISAYFIFLHLLFWSNICLSWIKTIFLFAKFNFPSLRNFL